MVLGTVVLDNVVVLGSVVLDNVVVLGCGVGSFVATVLVSTPGDKGTHDRPRLGNTWLCIRKSEVACGSYNALLFCRAAMPHLEDLAMTMRN